MRAGGAEAYAEVGAGGEGRGAPGGGAGKPADPVSVLRPLPSQCLPGSRTEEAGAAQARKRGEGSAVGDWGETFSGPLNRPPTLVAERGTQRQKMSLVPSPIQFRNAYLLPNERGMGKDTCPVKEGSTARVTFPRALAASPPTPFPSPHLSSRWGWDCLERVGPAGRAGGSVGGGGTWTSTEWTSVLSLRPFEWHRLIPVGLRPSFRPRLLAPSKASNPDLAPSVPRTQT